MNHFHLPKEILRSMYSVQIAFIFRLFLPLIATIQFRILCCWCGNYEVNQMCLTSESKYIRKLTMITLTNMIHITQFNLTECMWIQWRRGRKTPRTKWIASVKSMAANIYQKQYNQYQLLTLIKFVSIFWAAVRNRFGGSFHMYFLSFFLPFASFASTITFTHSHASTALFFIRPFLFLAIYIADNSQ